MRLWLYRSLRKLLLTIFVVFLKSAIQFIRIFRRPLWLRTVKWIVSTNACKTLIVTWSSQWLCKVFEKVYDHGVLQVSEIFLVKSIVILLFIWLQSYIMKQKRVHQNAMTKCVWWHMRYIRLQTQFIRDGTNRATKRMTICGCKM